MDPSQVYITIHTIDYVGAHWHHPFKHVSRFENRVLDAGRCVLDHDSLAAPTFQAHIRQRAVQPFLIATNGPVYWQTVSAG